MDTVRCTSTSASPGSRCAATWNTRSGLTSLISASMAARSLTSAYRYSAAACLGQLSVTPRLTLTRRPGHRAASWAISAEPMQPGPAGHQHGGVTQPVSKLRLGQAQPALGDGQEARVLLRGARLGRDERLGQVTQLTEGVVIQAALPGRRDRTHAADDLRDPLHPIPPPVIAVALSRNYAFQRLPARCPCVHEIRRLTSPEDHSLPELPLVTPTFMRVTDLTSDTRRYMYTSLIRYSDRRAARGLYRPY